MSSGPKLLLTGVLALCVMSSNAYAYGDHRDHDERGEHHEHEYYEHEFEHEHEYHRHRHFNRYPNVVYVPSATYYYAPPQVVYYPQPFYPAPVSNFAWFIR